MTGTNEKIKARAYELFVNRDGNGGGQLDDWLKAEIEIKRKSAGLLPVNHHKTTMPS